MAMLSLTLASSPASYAWRALPADVADRNYAGAPRRQRLIAVISIGTAEPTTVELAAEASAVIESVPEDLLPFTHLEMMVIRIGQGDRLLFLEPGGRLARLRRFLFGTRPPNPLANGRLEALRLVVIALRQRHRSAADAIETALAAGISRSQLDALAAELRSSAAS